MTATLPRPQLTGEPASDVEHRAVVARWHDLRRLSGIVAVALGIVAGVVLAWPAMAVAVLAGAVLVVDATVARRTGRSDVAGTLVGDITLSGLVMFAVAVPAAAIGMAVAYWVLVLAVFAPDVRWWPIGLYAVVVGVLASILPGVFGIENEVVRSLVAGIVVVAVFGLLSIAVAAEFIKRRRAGEVSTDRRIELADAVAAASASLVASDDVAALANALEVVRSALGATTVVAERNVEDPVLGTASVVVECVTLDGDLHPSVEPAAKAAWSSMPGARSHLEGGAPFFYRVEESRGTSADRGSLRVEVDVPIFVDGTWAGVIGAADVDPERVWKTNDLLLLRTLADLTGAFWLRGRNEKERDTLIGSLDGRIRYERALARASGALLGEQGGDLGDALEAIGLAADVDEVVVTTTVRAADGSPVSEAAEAWSAPGFDPTVAVGDVWSFDELGTLRADLQSGAIATSASRGVARLVSTVEVEGAWYGSVWFLTRDVGRVWTDREFTFARTIGEMLAAFYGRERSRKALEASIQSKDQLIASVSHELRTPLTAVGGLAGELKDGGDAFDADMRSELLGVIQVETAEMADLVEDLLVAARSDDASLPVFPEEIDLLEAARTTMASVSIPDGTSVTIEKGAVLAHADPVRVRQILRNLLTNAFRYGGEEITVRADSGSTMSTVTVHDNGDGIPPEDRALVFSPYGRSRTGAVSKASVGLGLTLSRRLAELMSGTLDYVDGDGCTFRLTVPARPRD